MRVFRYELFDFHHNLLGPPKGPMPLTQAQVDLKTILAMHPHGVVPIQVLARRKGVRELRHTVQARGAQMPAALARAQPGILRRDFQTEMARILS